MPVQTPWPVTHPRAILLGDFLRGVKADRSAVHPSYPWVSNSTASPNSPVVRPRLCCTWFCCSLGVLDVTLQDIYFAPDPFAVQQNSPGRQARST
eukprot:4557607-Pleurochrysis_carterae.AAC.1